MMELQNDRITERQKDRQGKSSIAPTFSKRGYNNFSQLKISRHRHVNIMIVLVSTFMPFL